MGLETGKFNLRFYSACLQRGETQRIVPERETLGSKARKKTGKRKWILHMENVYVQASMRLATHDIRIEIVILQWPPGDQRMAVTWNLIHGRWIHASKVPLVIRKPWTFKHRVVSLFIKTLLFIPTKYARPETPCTARLVAETPPGAYSLCRWRVQVFKRQFSSV